jgi:hypothetical protein
MVRVSVTLQPEEKNALWALAQRERRDPRAQAALIIRRELERAGLLPAEVITPQPQPSEVRNETPQA